MELLNWLKQRFAPKSASSERGSRTDYSNSGDHDHNVFDDTYFANSSHTSCSANESGGSNDSCSSDSGSSDSGGGGGDGD